MLISIMRVVTPPRSKNVRQGVCLGMRLLLALMCLLLFVGKRVEAVDCSSDGAFTVHPAPSGALNADDVYILNLLTVSDAADANIASSLWAGVDAALFDASYTVAGRAVHVVSPADPVTVSDVVAFATRALACDYNILAAVGPFSDANLRAMQSAIASAAEGSALKSLLLIGPYTASTAVRRWDPNTYFLRPDPLAEVLALVHHVLVHLATRRVGVMYLQGNEFGEPEAQRTNELLTAAGRGAATVYAPRFSDANGVPSTLDEALFNRFADARPGAIFILGAPGAHTRSFIKRCLTDERTSAASVLTTQAVQYELAAVVQGLTEAKTPHKAPALLASGTNYPVSANSPLYHITHFQDEMQAYIASGTSPYPIPATGDIPVYISDTKRGALQVMGWLTGHVLRQMLLKDHATTSRESFRAGAFDQARYVVGQDFVLGDFGGPCVGAAASLGAACSCNQGGRATILKNMDFNGEISLNPAPPFIYANNICYSRTQTLPMPVIAAVLAYSDDPIADLIMSQIETGLVDLTSNSASQDTALIATNAMRVATTTATAAADLIASQSDYFFDIFLGPLHANVVPTTMFAVGPMYTRPHTHNGSVNTVHVIPTLEQQTYIAYEYMDLLLRKGLITEEDVTVLVRDASASEVERIRTLVDRTAAVFGLSNPTFHSLDTNADASALLTTNGLNIFIGFSLMDVPVVHSLLTENKGAHLLVDFASYATAYPTLLSAFTPSATDVTLTSRLTTATNFPQWNKNSATAHAESALLTSFHEKVPESTSQTPRALEMYIVERLVASLGLLMTLPIGQTFSSEATPREAFYRGSVHYVDDLLLGPYMDCSTIASSPCENRNYGATKVGVLSLASIFDFSHPFELAPKVPSLDYTVPAKDNSLTKAQIAGIVVGCVAAVGILIAVLLIIFCCCCNNSRDNKNAPKELSDPVTLVFTDIESSTALWAACPTIMPDAVSTHHKIIRQLIASYKCYEVKTIGDSFMIACKSPSAAVMVARGIQTKFLKHDWKTTALDDAYRSFEKHKSEEEEGYLVRSAHLSPEEYAKVWNGLRVRVGIHTGLSDIRQDEITKGFDYYGETSNMAARTEAIANGGQVVMTESTWWALSQQEREMFHCTDFGPQGLRGVPYGVGMYQLEVVPNRIYGDLRTEIELEFDDEYSTSDGPTSSRFMLASIAGTMTRGATAVAAVLTSCFCVYQTRQRVKELQPLLVRWGIAVPDRRAQRDDLEDYCHLLINLVALKIATVTEAQMRIPEATHANHLADSWAAEDDDRPPHTEEHADPTGMTLDALQRLQSVSVEEGDNARALSAVREARERQNSGHSANSLGQFNGLSLWRQAHGRSRRYRRHSAQTDVSEPAGAAAANPLDAMSPIGAHVEEEDAAQESDPVFKRMPLDMMQAD